MEERESEVTGVVKIRSSIDTCLTTGNGDCSDHAYLILHAFFMALRPRFLGQSGLLRVAFASDHSQAASGSHVANTLHQQ